MCQQPNVLLVTIDTLRADILGYQYHGHSVTPNLDQLASTGISFSQAVTGGSWTQAAFPVLFTSTYASEYGGCLGRLSVQRPSGVEMLAGQGYLTAGFSTSPLLSATYGYDRGFQHFVDLVPTETDPWLRRVKGGQRLLRIPVIHSLANRLKMQTRPAQLYKPANDVTNMLCKWLDETESPFFAWAHFMDVHWPYHREEMLQTPDEIATAWQDLARMHRFNEQGKPIKWADRAHLIDLYLQSVQYVDAQIGRLLQHLRKLPNGANTIVIVVADHGEEFLDHQRWGHWENNLYDEILKVPLIMHVPGAPTGLTIDRQVRTLDIMPTILDLCGLDSPHAMRGTRLTPLWNGNCGVYDTDLAVSEMWREDWHIVAVRSEKYKYIWDSRVPVSGKLFDLEEDKSEQKDVAAAYPMIVQTYHQQVDAVREYSASSSPTEAASEVELDQAVVARLRDLGYLA